ncbi:MAG: aminotransferase class I/II-fold pyridoxal phosphate-dependent enzyme [Acidobacteriota bacterium]
MKIPTFEMERWQSLWENHVEYNLSESGVQPLTPAKLLEISGTDPLLQLPLGYGHTNGTPELRAAIAAMYAGASVDNVVCTNGGSEANFVVCWNLFEPGDEVAMMLPQYMQMPGLARYYGIRLRPFFLRAELNWQPDLDELESAVNEKTRAIVVCNPNNPTGAVLEEAAMQRIVALAGRFNCWIVADEIYRGSEFDGRLTPSFWGLYDRVLITSGLSKAYGLPGLRIGWVAGPAEKISELWSCRDYTSIAVAAPSDLLAQLALEPQQRERILARTRGILQANFPILEKWLEEHADDFEYTSPQAGAICWVRDRRRRRSSELVEALRKIESVLVVPGDQLEMDGYLRFGFGYDAQKLERALERISRFLRLQASGSRLGGIVSDFNPQSAIPWSLEPYMD